MFFGQYEHSIDDKNRITLPARFRAELADGVVLSKGLDGSVDVYPRETWQVTVGERIGRLDQLLPDARMLQRHFFGGARSTRPCLSGVSSEAPPLLAHGKLAKDVTVIGNNDHLEIWDRAAWAERLEAIEGSADHAAQRLAAQSI